MTGLRPGADALVEAVTADGTRVGLLVLDAATARTAYRGTAWGAERLLLSADPVVFDRDEVRVHSTAAQPSFAVAPGATVKASAEGVLTRYTLVTAEHGDAFPAVVTPVRAAEAAPAAVTGVQGRASVPDDTHVDTVAAEYRVELPEAVLDRADGADRTLLRLTWTGDVARAYAGDTLVADQFHSGRPWDIALDRLPAEALRGAGLRLRILPLAVDAPVYLPAPADTARGTAVIHRADLLTSRVRAVRAG